MNRLMKNIFLVIFISISSLAYSQTIYKIWVGENLEYLELTKRKANFDYGYHLNDYGISYKDSLLRIIDYFWQAGKFGRQHEDYFFKVLKLTNDTLIVSPLNERAKNVINNKEKFVFVDKTKLYKTELKFQRISFSGTGCFGNCPTLKIEIDSTGIVNFLGEYNTGSLKGFYKGQLTPNQLAYLIELLKMSELDRFPRYLGDAIDAPNYNFKFYYNGKTRTSEGYFIPYFNHSLLNYLLNIYNDINFEKSEEIYEFGK